MNEYIHILAVDSNSSSVIESVKASGYPIHRAYVVHRKKEAEGEVEKLRKTLSILVDTKVLNFEGKEIYEIVCSLLEIIRKEKESKNITLISATDSDRILSMALIIVAQISESKLYAGFDSQIKFLLIPPLKKFNYDRIQILKALIKEGGSVDSLNKLIMLVDGKIEEKKKYMAQRARMSYHLNELGEDRLIETERRGKNLRISITDLGKAYVIMYG